MMNCVRCTLFIARCACDTAIIVSCTSEHVNRSWWKNKYSCVYHIGLCCSGLCSFDRRILGAFDMICGNSINVIVYTNVFAIGDFDICNKSSKFVQRFLLHLFHWIQLKSFFFDITICFAKNLYYTVCQVNVINQLIYSFIILFKFSNDA